MLVNILIGILLGFLSGLGIGGGSLLILWLTLIAGIPAETARAVNLMFFLAAAGCVTLFRIKSGSLDKGAIIPTVISGCLAAGIGAYFGKLTDPTLLRTGFGILLIVTGLREFLYRPRKAK